MSIRRKTMVTPTRTDAPALRRMLAGTTALTTAAVCGWLLTADPAWALPTDGTVVEGQAEIIYGQDSVTIQQGSDRVIIEWQTFDVGSHESVTFIQPHELAAALNRVLSGDASQILGSLSANGQVFISNPAGVVFGPDANVDVASIVATSLDIMNDRFMAGGRLEFDIAGDPTAVVENRGTINASGLAALVGPAARNTGAIVADVAILGGGQGFALDYYGDGLVNFAITDPTTQLPVDYEGNPVEALVDNTGTIIADGGQVILTADAAAGVIDNVINVDGIIQARTIGTREGQVVLLGSDEGTVQVAGTIDATGDDAGEQGGTVHVLGERLELTLGADIDMSGQAGGGTALIGGAERGGPMAAGGHIAYGQLEPAARGPQITIDTTTTFETERTIPTADITYVGADVTLAADATDLGNGGTVVVWGDQEAAFHGHIRARGGANGGNGGFAEVSSANVTVTGAFDLGAAAGQSGSVLIDPTNLCAASTATGCSGLGSFVNIATTILPTLASGTNFTLDTTSPPPGVGGPTNQAGNIVVVDPISYGSAGALTFLATGNVTFNSSVQNSGTGAINVVAGWDGTTTNIDTILATPSAYGVGGGAIFIGNGSQTAGIAVGSRFGASNFAGAAMTLLGSTTANFGFAQAGFRADSNVIGFNINGPITIALSDGAGNAGDLRATAGTQSTAYVQVGHGGADLLFGGFEPEGNYAGDITIVLANDLIFNGGTGSGGRNYAQLGHGGRDVQGSHSGTIRITRARDLTFTAGTALDTYAQLGHGGLSADGNHSGGITITQARNLTFTSRIGTQSYAQFGHGGRGATGNHSGAITIGQAGDITFSAGNNYVQLGHGGDLASGNHSGAITISQAGNLTLTGGNTVTQFAVAYAQIGHGSASGGASGTRQGNIDIRVTGETSLVNGTTQFDVNRDNRRWLIGHATTTPGGISNADISLSTGTLDFSAVATSTLFGMNADFAARMAGNLAGGTVTLAATNGTAGANGGMTVGAAFVYNSANALTLSSITGLRIAANVENAGTGNITVTAGETAAVDTSNVTVNPGVTVRSTGGTVTLRAGDDVIVGAGATLGSNGALNLTAGFNDGGDGDGGLTISAGAILSGTPINLTALNNIVLNRFTATVSTVNVQSTGGTVSLTDTSGPYSFGALSVTGTSINLGAAINTAGAQTYNNPILLTGGTVLSSTGNGNITFNAAIDGAQALTVNTGGTTSFLGAVGTTTALTRLITDAPGTTVLSGGRLVLSGSTVTFDDAVTLIADTTITDTGAVTFGSTVNGAFGLTVNAGGNVTFGGAVGGATPLNFLSATSDGTIATNAITTANGNVTFEADAMTLGAAVNAGTGEIALRPRTAARTINLGTNVANSLSLTAAEIGQITARTLSIGSGTSGDITVSAQIAPANVNTLFLRTAGAVVDANATGPDITVTNLAIISGAGVGAADALETAVTNLAFGNLGGAFSLANTGALTILAVPPASSSINLGTTTTITAAGPVTIAANLVSAGTLMVTAGETAAANTDNVSVNESVTVQSTGGDVTLRAGDDVIVGNGATLSANGALSLTAGFNDGGDGDGGLTIGTGVTLIGNPINLTALNDIILNRFTATGSTVNVQSTGGTVSLTDTSAPYSLGALSVTGTSINLGATIDSTGTQTYNNPVLLTADTVLSSTGSGNITFNAAIDGAQALTVNTGGTTSFLGAVGTTTALTRLTTDAPGTTVLGGGRYILSGSTLTLNDAVTLTADTTITDAGAVTFGSTVNGAFGLTIGAGGNVTFGGAVGGITPLTFLSVTSDGTIFANAAITTANGDVTFEADAMTIGAAVNAGTGIVTLRPRTGARPIILGTETAGTLSLTDAEFDRITASILRIGSATASDIAITAPISPANVSTLSLQTAGGVVRANVASTDITVANLAIRSGTGVNLATEITNLAFANTAGQVVIGNTGDLTITAVDGLTTSSNTGTGLTYITASGVLTFAANTSANGSGIYFSSQINVNNGVTVSSNSVLRFDGPASGTVTVNLDGNLTAGGGIAGSATTINVISDTGGAEIQDAVDVALENATAANPVAINVAVGTYAGFTVNKAFITVDGAGSDLNPAVGTVIRTGSPAIIVAANNTTLQDMALTFAGVGAPGANDVGILLDGTAAPNLTGVQIVNVDFSNLHDGIRSQGDIGDGNAATVDVTIRGNANTDRAVFQDFVDAAIDVGDTDGDAVYLIRDLTLRDGADADTIVSGGDGIRVFSDIGAATIKGVIMAANAGDTGIEIADQTNSAIQIGGLATADANTILGNRFGILTANLNGGSLVVARNTLVRATQRGMGIGSLTNGAIVGIVGNAEIRGGTRAIAVSSLTDSTLSIAGNSRILGDGTDGISFANASTNSTVAIGPAFVTVDGVNTLFGGNGTIQGANDALDIDEINGGTFTVASNGTILGTVLSGIEFDDTISNGAVISIVGNTLIRGGIEGIEFERPVTGSTIAIAGNTSIRGDTADGIVFFDTLTNATIAIGPATVSVAGTPPVFAGNLEIIGGTNGVRAGNISGGSFTVANNPLIRGNTVDGIRIGNLTNGALLAVAGNIEIRAGTGATTAGGISILSADTSTIEIAGNTGIFGNLNGIFVENSLTNSILTIGPATVTVNGIATAFGGNGQIVGGEDGIDIGAISGSRVTVANNQLIQGNSVDGIRIGNLTNGALLAVAGNTEIRGGNGTGATGADGISIQSANASTIVIAGNLGIFGNIDGIFVRNSLASTVTIGAATVMVDNAETAFGGNGQIVGGEDGIDIGAITSGSVTVANNPLMRGNRFDGISIGNITNGALFEVVGNAEIRGGDGTGASGLDGIRILGANASTIVIAGNTGIFGNLDGIFVESSLINSNVTIGPAIVTVNGVATAFGGNGQIVGVGSNGISVGAIAGGSFRVDRNTSITGLDDGIDFNAAISNNAVVEIVGNGEIRGNEDGIDINAITGGTFTVSNNTQIRGVAQTGIEFESALTGNSQITIDLNRDILGGTNGFGIEFRGAVGVTRGDTVTVLIDRNGVATQGGAPYDGTQTVDLASFVITGGIRGGGFGGIGFVDTAGTVPDGIGGAAQVTISRNMIDRSGGSGIDIESVASTGTTAIHNNFILDNGGNGILFFDDVTSRTEVFQNYIARNGGDGVRVGPNASIGTGNLFVQVNFLPGAGFDNGNGGFAYNQLGTGTPDLDGNWWGTPFATGVAAAINGAGLPALVTLATGDDDTNVSPPFANTAFEMFAFQPDTIGPPIFDPVLFDGFPTDIETLRDEIRGAESQLDRPGGAQFFTNELAAPFQTTVFTDAFSIGELQPAADGRTNGPVNLADLEPAAGPGSAEDQAEDLCVETYFGDFWNIEPACQ